MHCLQVEALLNFGVGTEDQVKEGDDDEEPVCHGVATEEPVDLPRVSRQDKLLHLC